MKFYNLIDRNKKFSLCEAVLTGIQGNEGLLMPEAIPVLKQSFFDSLPQYSLQQIGFEIAKVFLHEDVEAEAIRNIVNEALYFDIPLIQIDERLFVLELFHGPTLAFKDIGARFMARLFAYLLNGSDQSLYILVATSGDTGSAVANAFWNIPRIRVIILYPSGKISFLQEQQITTLGHNITALEIEGTFDDCQLLVKQALADDTLRNHVTLASANSINLARLIPQSFYYFHAYAQLHRQLRTIGRVAGRIAVSVPSGNFGNLTAGLFAKKMGLPIHQFIAATNINNVVPRYLETGIFEPQPSRPTISNAMDVGNPSNFSRIIELYNHDHAAIKQDVVGFTFTDDATRHVMREVFQKHYYTLDPHGAIGYAAATAYLKQHPNDDVILLETAHPAKFMDVVEKTLRIKIKIPNELTEVVNKKKLSVRMPANYQHFKNYLMKQ
jgi:threonine synthase